MIIEKNKKLIGVVKDKDLKMGILIFAFADDEAEEKFITKMCEAFEKGLIVIGYNAEKKNLFTTPSVVELIKKGLI
jgi:hypothetical protein